MSHRPWWILYACIIFGQFGANSEIVKKCPLNETEWMTREGEVMCDHKNSMFYHCFRDINEDLREECRKFIEADPKRGCPYFMGDSDLQFMKCTDMTGCPNETDPLYFTNELYKYPSCLKQQTDRRRMDTTAPSDLSVGINSSMESTRNSKINAQTTEISTSTSKLGAAAIIGIVIGVLVPGNFCVVVIVVYIIKRKRAKVKPGRKIATIMYSVSLRSAHIYDAVDDDDGNSCVTRDYVNETYEEVNGGCRESAFDKIKY